MGIVAAGALIVACDPAIPERTIPPTVDLRLTAEAIAFDAGWIDVPAGVAVTIDLDNRDVGVPHGMVLATRTSGVLPRELASSEIVTGPGHVLLRLPPLAPGPYLVMCPVHPIMQVEFDAR